ncbi:Tol-Pal system beta propeller repeat protein TolB [Legionella impletisoli]|uniref:Tol-Pal system protein TolB n=1 Tax=Legionella impletisoli TaxID=343510 RepID=A0A917JM73_9GAMM|nr:Tol-Pal system beta propeller repeat protein TolB [Legionella impletisoli]GGI76960.1 protein TolB [Legionella impletisoli]
MKRFVVLICILLANVTFALDLELTQGVNAALPIGINEFKGSREAKEVFEVIKNDLRLSGQFRIIPPRSNATQVDLPITVWRGAGADSVLSGSVSEVGSNQFNVRFELFDAAAHGRLLLTKSYNVRSNDLRALAHHISDEVYEKLTGERGVFSTRIAYILVQHSGERRKFTLEVADVDGHNPQTLLMSTEPIMSPTWSPDGKQIAYVSFENKRAQIYTVQVETGKRRLITSFTGINGAPAWSPDGQEMAVVLSKDGSPNIFSVNLHTGRMKQLTFGKAIDTEPRYSPDGKYLLFTSGRGGSPQIYRLELASGKVNRVTYEGNYNARASYTPNEKYIVMLHREDQRFNIGVQHLDTGRVDTLTSSLMDESPSVSPNGRLVLYATKHQDKGVLAVVSIDGRIRMRLPSREGDVQEPAWSPYLG